VLDSLLASPNRFLAIKAHGPAVGLPSDDDMGNSEVGHNALGCGRIVKQGAALVDAAVADGSIFTGSGFAHLHKAWQQGGALHMIGLLSDGGVHSRYDQMIAVARGAAARGCKKLRLHILLDGRDVPDGTSLRFVADLERDLAALAHHGCDAQIASGGGRMTVTMDRYEADWTVVERGFKAHALGQADHEFSSARDAVTALRAMQTDQYLPAFVIVKQGKPVGQVTPGDAVLFWNFRGDRSIEISRAFEDAKFDKFSRGSYSPASCSFAGMMSYDGDLNIPKHYLVAPPLIDRTSGEYLARTGLRTFAISETQKYGHVTYFWNGNRSDKFDNQLETFVEIPSDVCEFHEKPAMKAKEIADATVDAIRSGKYDILRLNFANGDMVGHTGHLGAAVEAMESVDRALGRMPTPSTFPAFVPQSCPRRPTQYS
jgi:2,3-bisphosphoglycerate-independent phosphoglycerate mutase